MEISMADSTVHLSEAETETFSDEEEISELENQNKCAICQRNNPYSQQLQHIFINDSSSFLLVHNIAWLYCATCQRFYHLRCVPYDLSVQDLLDIIETSYICDQCS